jgi:hypothetical protein
VAIFAATDFMRPISPLQLTRRPSGNVGYSDQIQTLLWNRISSTDLCKDCWNQSHALFSTNNQSTTGRLDGQ